LTVELDRLLPTQGGFRLPSSARVAMVEHVRDGGDFRSATSSAGRPTPIVIDRFPDSRLFVRDGLHRVTAILLGREDRRLWPGEYRMCEMSYRMYTSLDPADGWFTPFDPRAEVRLADIAAFKVQVVALLAAGREPHSFVLANRRLYCRARRPTDTFDSLARRWRARDAAPC
jgi:hypothetical protein